jgi:hypothetical protein
MGIYIEYILYRHLGYFMTIWYILCSFGAFFRFWYHVPRKIWQPCIQGDTDTDDESPKTEQHFFREHQQLVPQVHFCWCSKNVFRCFAFESNSKVCPTIKCTLSTKIPLLEQPNLQLKKVTNNSFMWADALKKWPTKVSCVWADALKNDAFYSCSLTVLIGFCICCN